MSILLSVNPPFAGWLVDGKKTVEWRKKLLPRGKAFIYETKKNGGSGKVIGECDITDNLGIDPEDVINDALIIGGCVDRGFLIQYACGERIYAVLCINAKRYKEPIPISQFLLSCDVNKVCFGCKHWNPNNPKNNFCERRNPLTRPPQSWCYVEDRGAKFEQIKMEVN